MCWHFLLAFDPPALFDPAKHLLGTPFYAFVHGTAAIGIFFVLSGYVLTIRYFETGKRRVLIIGASKRWLRLFMPVFLSIMASWVLFHFDLYSYEDAGEMSGSGWLKSFAIGMSPPFVPSFDRAVLEGLDAAFLHLPNSFNPLVWTIHIELQGSFIAFALAAFLAAMRTSKALIPLILVPVAILLHLAEPLLIAFIPGVLLAFYGSRIKNITPIKGSGLIVLGILFLSYRAPVGMFGFLSFLRPINNESFWAWTSSAGAVFIMLPFIGCDAIRRPFTGTAARLLGRLSFPLYLVHLILICSLGSAVFVSIREEGSLASAMGMAALVLIPAVFAAAAMLAWVDVKWVALVNNLFRRVRIPG
jgi:peptidoglycan/LPS O-acetylase OafA/YrhL